MVVPAVIPSSVASMPGGLQPWDWMKEGKSNVALSGTQGGRFRKELNETGREVVGAVLQATACAHGLAVEGLVFRPAGLYGIYNTRACCTHQAMHTDYGQHMVQHLHGTPLAPRSAIWAVRAPFTLGSVSPGRVLVHARRVIFFRHDWWHCGGPFISAEPRFHGFQLSATVHVPRAVYN